MATHSIILAGEIPRTEEPGGLQSMGLQRVGHDFINNNSCYRVWPRNGLGVPVTNGDAVPCSLMISKKKKKKAGLWKGDRGRRAGQMLGNSACPARQKSDKEKQHFMKQF